MVLKKLLGPLNLAKTQAPCIHKLTKIIIVSKDKDLKFATLQLMASSLEILNDSS